MKISNKRFTAFVLTVIIISLSISAYSTAGASMVNDTVITETLDIANARQNMSGPGYSWANRYDELTLSGVNIYTDSPYGLRLPNNCTVIVNGTNYIRAEKYGIACSGTVTFKGNGTLVVSAGDTGFIIVSQNRTHKIRILEGTYIFEGGRYGVYSEAGDFSFTGGSLTLKIPENGEAAVCGRCVNLLGGTVKSNGQIKATNELVVDAVNLEIDTRSEKEALRSENLLRIENITFRDFDEYTGQSIVSAIAEKRFIPESFIFKNGVPVFVDFLLIFGIIAVLVAFILIPIVLKKKKSRETIKRLEEEGIKINNR